MNCDLDYIKCNLKNDIEIYKNKVLIEIINIYLNALSDNDHHNVQIGGSRKSLSLSESRVDNIDDVLGNFGSSIGKSISNSIINSSGDIIKNAIGAIVGILPVGGTVFEIVSTVDEMSTLAMLQFINTFPIFFRSYLEFLHSLKGIDDDLSKIGKDEKEIAMYFDSITEKFEIGNLVRSMAFGKQHRSHDGDTANFIGQQFKNTSKTTSSTKNTAHRPGIEQIVDEVYNHVLTVNSPDTIINEKVIAYIKEHLERDKNSLIHCLTEWDVSAGSRNQWQTFSFQLQEYLDLRSSFQPNVDDSYKNAIRRALLESSITFEKLFEQGVLGSGVIMAFVLYVINNITVYKDLCMVSLIYWIHISKCILGEKFKPPSSKSQQGNPDLSSGFSCLEDFMKATEINDDVILAELNIYPQLLDNNIDYINDAVKQIIVTNMKFMSLCYRIFKVLDDIKQRPFDSAIGILQAFFDVGSNIIDIIDGEINKSK